MKTIKKWFVASIIGLIVILMGAIVSLSGMDAYREFSGQATIDNDYVYSFNFEVSAGGSVTGNYSLSSGHMAVSVLNEPGYKELIQTGDSTPSNIALYIEEATGTGNFSCTVPASNRYYVCFYDFNETSEVLSASGVYYGVVNNLIYGGIVICLIGGGIVLASLYIRYQNLRLLEMKEELAKLVIDPKSPFGSERSQADHQGPKDQGDA